MRIAVLVIALVLVVLLGLQLVFAARIAERIGAWRGITVPTRNRPVRIALGLLLLAGAIFALGKPMVSMVIFIVGAVLGIVAGATVLGVVSGVLAAMSYFGAREVARPAV